MANADFSQNRQTSPQGFGPESYRAPKADSAAPALTPLQQKLAGLEKALPAPLRRRAAAVLLCAVILAGSAVGAGAAKLRAKYNEAAGWYSVGVAADNGYTLSETLSERAYTAANVITSALHTLGEDAAEVKAAQQALEAFESCQARAAEDPSVMGEMYSANAALDSAIDQLYGTLQERSDTPLEMGAVQTQYGRFNSAGTILGSLQYNQAVLEYQKQTGGPWATLLKGLTGIREVDLFA